MPRKIILNVVLVMIPFLGWGQTNPFDDLERDSIVAYEYDGEAGYNIEECITNYPEKIEQSKIVDESKMIDLEKQLTEVDAYGGSTAACFDPHLGLVSWKDGKIVAAISICISCNYLSSTHEIPATSVNRIEVSDEYSYAAKGFSAKTRKVIYGFCQDLGYEKYIGTLESMFDK